MTCFFLKKWISSMKKFKMDNSNCVEGKKPFLLQPIMLYSFLLFVLLLIVTYTNIYLCIDNNAWARARSHSRTLSGYYSSYSLWVCACDMSIHTIISPFSSFILHSPLIFGWCVSVCIQNKHGLSAYKMSSPVYVYVVLPLYKCFIKRLC